MLLALIAISANDRVSCGATIDRWNILFIFTDDQTFRSVSCYKGAGEWSATPNIDRLASEGVRFQNAYSGPWCSPSRAMMMSGRQLHAIDRPTTLRRADGIAPIWQPQLKVAGYRCGFIGKWDLPPKLEGEWDRSVVWYASGDTEIKFDPIHYYSGMRVAIDGQQSRLLEGYSTDAYTEMAIEFIDADHAQPWFLWLCLGAPHVPSVPPDRYRNLYRDADVSLTDEADMFGPRANVPSYQHRRSEVTRNGARIEREFPKGMLMTDLIKDYAATVRAVDDSVGRLVDALRTGGQLDRTLIIFTSDDGMPFGEHGFVNKTGPYDACQRVPLIIRGPSSMTTAGETCRYPVSALDVIPTILATANVQSPYGLHGQDLRPLLRDPQSEWNHPMLLESFGFEAGVNAHFGLTPHELKINRPSPDGIPWWLMIRQGRYKYIRTLVTNEIEELYDLEEDPGERTNLALKAAFRDQLHAMRKSLLEELNRTDGQALAKNLPIPHER